MVGEFENIKELQIQPFETSSGEKLFLVTHNNKYFEANAATVQLIGVLQQTDSIEEAALRLTELKNRKCSEDDIVFLIEKYINPIFAENTAKHPFLIKAEIIPQKVIDSISGKLHYLFNPITTSILMIFILVSEILFFLHPQTTFKIGDLSIYMILGVMGLFILSSLFHEFGHASACRHLGIKSGGVGFGLYLHFPVFYTDVSSAWKLSRKERIIVNISGVYFQLIYLIPFFIVYFVTSNELVKYFIFTINLNLLVALNPFFKFDGYWITSDLLGVPNLRKRTNELLSYLLNKIKGKTVEKPFLLKIKSWEKYFLIIYSIVINIFFVMYFCWILPKILINFFQTFPPAALEFIDCISFGKMPTYSLFQTVIVQLFFFIFTMYFLYRMIYPILKKIWINHSIKGYKN